MGVSHLAKLRGARRGKESSEDKGERRRSCTLRRGQQPGGTRGEGHKPVQICGWWEDAQDLRFPSPPPPSVTCTESDTGLCVHGSDAEYRLLSVNPGAKHEPRKSQTKLNLGLSKHRKAANFGEYQFSIMNTISPKLFFKSQIKFSTFFFPMVRNQII